MGNKIVSLNFDKVRHKNLLAWIKKTAQECEMSVSGFCIYIIKQYYLDQIKGGSDE